MIHGRETFFEMHGTQESSTHAQNEIESGHVLFCGRSGHEKARPGEGAGSTLPEFPIRASIHADVVSQSGQRS
jgi:hypothetical protein